MNQTMATKAIAAILFLLALLGCSSAGSDGAEGEVPGLLELETFLTNIRDDSGDRYCKVTVKLAVTPAGRASELQEDPLMQARIRDEILTMLAGKTFAELSDPVGKEAFREEMRTKVGTLLPSAQIQQVLFSEFIVQ